MEAAAESPERARERLMANVLRIVYEYGMLRGRDIMRQVGLSDAVVLREILTKLANDRLITVQSGTLSPQSERGSLDAYVAPLPSGRAAAEQAMSRS